MQGKRREERFLQRRMNGKSVGRCGQAVPMVRPGQPPYTELYRLELKVRYGVTFFPCTIGNCGPL